MENSLSSNNSNESSDLTAYAVHPLTFPLIDDEEHYLSDPGVIHLDDLLHGTLNIIEAPCGAGKTSYVENVFWKQIEHIDKMLYITDSKNNLEAFKRRGIPYQYDNQIFYTHEGITAMNYAGFAHFCRNNPFHWKWEDLNALIVCDELQSCIKWEKIPTDPDNNLHALALEELHNRILLDACVVAISATPRKIRQEFNNEYLDVPIHAKLKHYKTKHTIKYQTINKVLDILPADKKGLIYVSHIKEMQSIKAKLERQRNIKCACIWSTSNTEHKMDSDGLRTREAILFEEQIPKDIQVVIINAACETGLNIKSDVDYVVINSTDEDTITQARGRIRHDINTAYLLTSNPDDITIIIPDEYLDRPLVKEDKKKLCALLGLRNTNGRLLEWPSIKPRLTNHGYEVIEERTSAQRTTRIVLQKTA